MITLGVVSLILKLRGGGGDLTEWEGQLETFISCIYRINAGGNSVLSELLYGQPLYSILSRG
jgi:hypothetical protein